MAGDEASMTNETSEAARERGALPAGAWAVILGGSSGFGLAMSSILPPAPQDEQVLYGRKRSEEERTQ